jgi:hypothetical protein
LYILEGLIYITISVDSELSDKSLIREREFYRRNNINPHIISRLTITSSATINQRGSLFEEEEEDDA